MQDDATRWGMETLAQYGVVGFGWVIAVYLFLAVMREKDGRREDLFKWMNKSFESQTETTTTLNRLITMLEAQK
jgi:hypothetical protein